MMRDMSQLETPTAQETIDNVHAVLDIIEPGNAHDELAAKYFKSGWDAASQENHMLLIAILEHVQSLRAEVFPAMEFFKAIPEAIERNPMMKMMFGKVSK